MICDECNRDFVSQTCFDRHKSETKVCKQIRKCEKCSKIIRDKNHECNKKKCKICKIMVPIIEHNCYITPNIKEKLEEEDKRDRVFIFYDFESQQIHQKMNEYIHKPNLCVVNIVCDRCWRSDLKDRAEEWCSFCGQKEYIFRGSKTVKEFNVFLFRTYSNYLKDRKKYSNLKHDISAYVIGHNSRGYDSQFILKYCVNNRMTPNVLKRGTKILSMRIGNFKFIDSLSFLPMPLKKLPQTFGLENTLQKGNFPFLFNTIGNEDYCGKWPDQKYYDLDFLPVNEREQFLIWYEKQKDKTFNFKYEIEKYCRSDTNILLRCVMLFRELFMKVSGLDPLSRSITIAMSVMEVFKTKYLKQNILAIAPPNGYEAKRKASYVGTVWLDYLEESRKLKIKREKKIGRYYCDGVINETKQCFEFYGCIWYGCFDCFPTKRSSIVNPFNGKSMENLYEYMNERESYIKNEGYTIESIWECQFNIEKRNSKTINIFCHNHFRNLKDSKIKPPLNPRDSFFGGRTCAIKLFHEVNQNTNEKINYYDVTSLYPFVVKNKQYPVGHPERIVKNINMDITEYNGFIFCKILPPKNLFFPVIPVRINNKLVFTLCYQCAYECNNNKCEHQTNERAIVGTYTTMEIKKSIEKNYVILEIYEIWNFPIIFPSKDNPGIFTDFINDFIKIKVEASGWPKSNMTNDEKDEYIRLYKEKEGIQLDYNNICNNPGMKAIGKLVVNSFWGKMGQRPCLSKTEYITEPQAFFKLLKDQTVKVNDALIISDETLQVDYEKETLFIEPTAHSSIFTASYTTSHARLILYELLEKLEKRVLYHDTDSIIFTSVPGQYMPNLGNYIGDLTNELSTESEPNAYITKFVSCGAKNYGYEVFYPGSNVRKYFCKVKGLCLNFNTVNIVNFDSMKSLIDETVQSIIDNKETKISEIHKTAINVPQKLIRVSPFLELTTKHIMKKYQFVYDKRRIIPQDYSTVPFGYNICELNSNTSPYAFGQRPNAYNMPTGIIYGRLRRP